MTLSNLTQLGGTRTPGIPIISKDGGRDMMYSVEDDDSLAGNRE